MRDKRMHPPGSEVPDDVTFDYKGKTALVFNGHALSSSTGVYKCPHDNCATNTVMRIALSGYGPIKIYNIPLRTLFASQMRYEHAGFSAGLDVNRFSDPDNLLVSGWDESGTSKPPTGYEFPAKIDLASMTRDSPVRDFVSRLQVTFHDKHSPHMVRGLFLPFKTGPTAGEMIKYRDDGNGVFARNDRDGGMTTVDVNVAMLKRFSKFPIPASVWDLVAKVSKPDPARGEVCTHTDGDCVATMSTDVARILRQAAARAVGTATGPAGTAIVAAASDAYNHPSTQRAIGKLGNAYHGARKHAGPAVRAAGGYAAAKVGHALEVAKPFAASTAAHARKAGSAAATRVSSALSHHHGSERPVVAVGGHRRAGRS